jgi:hypothetical protein
MSQFDTIITEIITGLKTETGIDNVYTALCNLKDKQPYPRLEVLHGNEIITYIDDSAQVWDSQCMIVVNLYASPSTIDDLLNLIRKYIVSVTILYINDSTARWTLDKGMTVSRNELPEISPIVWFQVTFLLHSRFLSTDL